MTCKTATERPVPPIAALENAEQHLKAARLLMARAADRAYEAGMHLQAIREQRLFEHAGHVGFDFYLDAEGFKRSTAYNNIRVFETFERADMAFGVSKLRLLVQAKFVNPRALLLEGIPVDGGPNRSIESFTCREFAAWVKAQPATGPLVDAIGTALEVLLGAPAPIEKEVA